MTGDPWRRLFAQTQGRGGGPPGSQCLPATASASVPVALLHPDPPSPAGFMWLRSLGSPPRSQQPRMHSRSELLRSLWWLELSRLFPGRMPARWGTPPPGFWLDAGWLRCPTLALRGPSCSLGNGACSWRERLLPSDTISTPGLGGNAEIFLWLMIS